ncbi:MAG: hypothetical protein ACKVH1_08045, partial [Alphaproteobacteria bacterium]
MKSASTACSNARDCWAKQRNSRSGFGPARQPPSNPVIWRHGLTR